MAKKASSPSAEEPERRAAVTAERFRRLYRLVQYLAGEPRTRDELTKHANLDVRGFYRDLELLRAVGIEIGLNDGKYSLTGEVADAIALLPFPDPRVTLGEMQQLAKGRSRLHQRIREEMEELLKTE